MVWESGYKSCKRKIAILGRSERKSLVRTGKIPRQACITKACPTVLKSLGPISLASTLSIPTPNRVKSVYPRIAVNTHSLLERLDNGFCDGIVHIYGVERRELRLDPRHRRPADKDDIIRAGASHDCCNRAGGGDLRRFSLTTRSSWLDPQRAMLRFHSEVMVILVLLPRHQAKTIYCFPSSDYIQALASFEQNNYALGRARD